jgi:hypothetical protein
LSGEEHTSPASSSTLPLQGEGFSWQARDHEQPLAIYVRKKSKTKAAMKCHCYGRPENMPENEIAQPEPYSWAQLGAACSDVADLTQHSAGLATLCLVSPTAEYRRNI